MAETGYQLICPKCYRPVQPAEAFCQGCGAERDAVGWARDPMIGKIIGGKYRVDSRLGAGGMGAVFRATQRFGGTDLGQVVIKFLLAEHVKDPERRDRFLKEARAARELRSPHVVKVFDFGEDDDGAPYLVMEYLEGKSLFRVVQQAVVLPVRRALLIAAQVAEAMVECHDKGILHRDLKPDNLLLLDSRGGDFVKIVDFGIARVPAPAQGEKSTSLVSSLVIGTPRYMAPEQILGKPIDGRIDIFALGVILYETLCGCTPIPLRTGDNEMAYVALNVGEPPRKVSHVLPGVPPELDALVDRMMAKAPEERPASMADVLLAIEQLLKLPELQEEASSAFTVVTRPEAAELLTPLPPPSTLPPGHSRRQRIQKRWDTTRSVLREHPHRLVAALLGAVAGLTLLVIWLLRAPAPTAAEGHVAPAPIVAERAAAAGTPDLLPPAPAPPPVLDELPAAPMKMKVRGTVRAKPHRRHHRPRMSPAAPPSGPAQVPGGEADAQPDGEEGAQPP